MVTTRSRGDINYALKARSVASASPDSLGAVDRVLLCCASGRVDMDYVREITVRTTRLSSLDTFFLFSSTIDGTMLLPVATGLLVCELELSLHQVSRGLVRNIS
jgi:TRAP-type mannitol/chloroaromatic compound transport system permease large subunit